MDQHVIEVEGAEPQPAAVSETTPSDVANFDFTQYSDAELRELESGDAARIAAVLKVPPPPQKNDKGPDKEPDKGPDKEPDKEPKDDDGPDRASLKAIKNAKERVAIVQAIQLVREGKHETIQDALWETFDFAARAAPASANQKADDPAPQPQPEPQADPEVAALEEQLKALEGDLKAANDAFDYGQAMTKVAEIATLRSELAFARRDAQARQTEQRAWEAQEEASRGRVLEKFGEAMTDPDSEFSNLLDVEILLAERRNDEILTKPDWPERIAERAAKRLNGGGAKPKPDKPEGPTQPAPQGVRLPGSPVGSRDQPAQMSVDDALRQLNELPADERIKILALAEEKAFQQRRR